jgi:hypothetical protein
MVAPLTAAAASAASKAAKDKKFRRRVGVGCLFAVLLPVFAVALVVIGMLGGAQMILAGFDEAEGLASAEPTAGGEYSAGEVSYDPAGSTFVDRGGAANAWGGHANGRIPASELCSLSVRPALRARCDAVAALDRMNVAYRAAFGVDTVVSDAYRDYDGQVAAKRSWCARGACHMAATPGTSNHGWALAFDLGGGINSYGSAQYAWMKNHGSSFGFYHPTWAEPGHRDYAKSEPWHWQYLAGADPYAG